MDSQGTGKYSGGTAMLSGGTLLHGDRDRFWRACRSGEIDVLDRIYEIFPGVLNCRVAFGMSPVHVAAEHGKLSVLEWLRDHGADFALRTRPRKQTPLHLAAEKGLVTPVEWLVHHAQALGCDIDAKDYRKRTATELAKLYGHKEVASILKTAKRVPMKSFLEASGSVNAGILGTGSGWDALSREQLIQSLTDLKSLHKAELDERRSVEEKHFWEISMLKSEMVDVKKQLSELGSLVRHLINSDGDGIQSAFQAKLAESARKQYLRDRETVSGVRVETAQIASSSGYTGPSQDSELDDSQGLEIDDDKRSESEKDGMSRKIPEENQGMEGQSNNNEEKKDLERGLQEETADEQKQQHTAASDTKEQESKDGVGPEPSSEVRLAQSAWDKK